MRSYWPLTSHYHETAAKGFLSHDPSNRLSEVSNVLLICFVFCMIFFNVKDSVAIKGGSKNNSELRAKKSSELFSFYPFFGIIQLSGGKRV